MSNSATPAITIYPVPASAKQPPQTQIQSQTGPGQTSSHHSNGSFGPVFIVLAVILVISGLACLIGRLCNKRTLKRQQQQHPKQNQTQTSNGTPPNHPSFPTDCHERDMELGYPGSRQPHSGPKEFSDTDNEFDRRSKSSNSKPLASNGGGQGMRNGGYSSSSPYGTKKPDHSYLDQVRRDRPGLSP